MSVKAVSTLAAAAAITGCLIHHKLTDKNENQTPVSRVPTNKADGKPHDARNTINVTNPTIKIG